MSLIQFTRNHSDRSTDKGYQFEFFCDEPPIIGGADEYPQPLDIRQHGSVLRGDYR